MHSDSDVTKHWSIIDNSPFIIVVSCGTGTYRCLLKVYIWLGSKTVLNYEHTLRLGEGHAALVSQADSSQYHRNCGSSGAIIGANCCAHNHNRIVASYYMLYAKLRDI
jgi:hypothetical protein